MLALGFGLLAAISAASIALDAQSQSDAERVTRTLEVANKLLNLRLPISAAESAQRGYRLTGDKHFLDDYRGAVGRIMPAFAELATLTNDNPAQQQTLAEIKPSLALGLAALEQPLDSLASDVTGSTAIADAGTGEQGAMGFLADGFDRLSAEENRLLALRSAASRWTGKLLLAVDLLGVAAIVVVALASVMIFRRSNRDRDTALRDAGVANAGLHTAALGQTADLRVANEEIRRSSIVLSNSAIVVDNTIGCMAEAVVVVDEYRTLMLANPAATRLFGYRPGMTAEQWGKLNSSFFPDDDAPLTEDRKPIARALRGEQFDGMEVVVRRADATDVYVVASGRPLVGASGDIKGAVLVYHDVTEAREIERQLRQAQKIDAIGQLTGGIAHDFNNMLTVITGTIDILAAAVAHDPQLAEIAKLIDQATRRGAEMTAHLLAFARKQPLRPQSTDVNALIAETAMLIPAIGEHIEIVSMLDAEAWPALVDAGQLATALLNLSINARDAMPDGGKLTLESRNVSLDKAYAQLNVGVTPGPYVLIAVTDSGTGIPAAIRDQVFDPFFTTKGIGKGTGLGLSMVYGFIKQSNGHIKIESEVGRGTRIELYLPRATELAAEAAHEAPPESPERGSETILVVEDDLTVLDFVVTALESLGYTTIAASSAERALAISDARTPFDLLLTDVVMPGMNGAALAAEIVALRPRLKVLYTSGYAENLITHEGQLDSGVLLLSKPYRKHDLARMVRAALDQGQNAALLKIAKPMRRAHAA
jgi:PAS domain S-box-containing protein